MVGKGAKSKIKGGKPRKQEKEVRKEEASDADTDSSMEDNVCGDCEEDVIDGQDGVSCDLCKVWFHIVCVRITKQEYRFMQNSQRFKWFCRACDGKFGNLAEVNRELNDRINNMEGNQDNMSDRLNIFQKEMEQMREAISKLGNKVEETSKANTDWPRLGPGQREGRPNGRGGDAGSQIDIGLGVEMIREEVSENQEREKKKKNMIIFNVPESEAQESERRKSEDKEWCRKIFTGEDGLGLNIDEEKIIEVIRLGRKVETGEVGENERKPRPILVKMDEVGIKWGIIKKAKKLKESREETISKVIIVPDMTIKQREKEKELRNELEQKRRAGELDWYIKKGELVKKTFRGQH